jgi:uncharacterized membrane protein
MADHSEGATAGTIRALPPPIHVRAATLEDVVVALELGFRDFRAAPQFGLFFGGVYALGGMAITYMSMAMGLVWLAFPLAAGFALIGPFAAVGLYEVSRRREAGALLTWGDILTCVIGQGKRELGWMALIAVFAFILWTYQARLLFALFFGISGTISETFLQDLFTTEMGLAFLALGTAWGALLSLIVFSLTVISFPLLLDQDRDFITAMITSVKAVTASPVVMLGWGLVTAGVLLLAASPFFLGFFIAMPVLGHTTWHLYRRIVGAEAASM